MERIHLEGVPSGRGLPGSEVFSGDGDVCVLSVLVFHEKLPDHVYSHVLEAGHRLLGTFVGDGPEDLYVPGKVGSPLCCGEVHENVYGAVHDVAQRVVDTGPRDEDRLTYPGLGELEAGGASAVLYVTLQCHALRVMNGLLKR